MKQITALKSSEICMAVKKQCTGSYNSKHIYQVDCNNSCEGTEHTYKCGLENCAINKAKCEKFLEFKNLLKKLIATDTTTENFKVILILNFKCFLTFIFVSTKLASF